MKKISLALITIFAFSLNVLAQGDVSKSKWKLQDILIDGNDREWKQPLKFYDDKTGLLFAICNDTRNLYLAFTLKDAMKMRKLMIAGWSVGLSSKEKKKKFTASLVFPGVITASMANRRPGDFEKKVSGNPFIKDYQSKLKTILAKGFRSNQTEIHLHDPNGIDIAVGANKEEYIFYEMSIPLTELMDGNFIHLNELITLNIAVNALDRPSFARGERGDQSGRIGGRPDGAMSGMGGGRQGGAMGGGRGGMGSGSGGGMSRGGYGGNSPGDRSSLFEKVSFKQKFTLAKD